MEFVLICFQCKETNDEGTAYKICQGNFNLTSTGLCMDFSGSEEWEDEKCLKYKELDFDDTWTSYCLNKKYGYIKEYIKNWFKCDDDFDLFKCTKCYDGYCLDEEDYSSKKCKKGCSICTDSHDCNSCSEGYYMIKEIYLSNINVQCEKCIDGCKIYNNNFDCNKCFPGYYLTNEKSEIGLIECGKCSKGCIECLEENVCLVCDEGY